MRRLKVFYPVLVATGVMAVIVGIVVLFLYISSPGSFAQKLSQQIQLPNINTDSEKIDTHVIGGNLEVSNGLKTQSLSAQSVTTNGIVFGAVSDELKEGMLYRAADGSLRYFDGTDSIRLGTTTDALQPAIPGPTGATGPSGQASAAPGVGTCPSCADDSLSNLNEVALSSNLLPSADNTIDLGDNGLAFQNGYINNVLAQNIYTTSLDSAAPGVLSIGTTNATSISLAQNTTITSDKSLTANGAVLFRNATDTLSAFEVQQASGATILSVDTVNGRIGIGTATPDYALDVSGDVNVSSGSGYRIDGTEICSASGCTAASGSDHYIQNQNSAQQPSSNFWLSGTGRADTGLQAPSLDTSSAGALSIGSTNATAINLAQNTTIAAGKSLTANGSVLFQNATNSTTAFQIQDAAGAALLRADTAGGSLSVGTFVPTTVVTPLPVTTNSYVTTTSNQQSGASADFNGDGKADIAVSSTDTNIVSVLMNTGTGTFAAKVDYGTGSSPRSVTAADFNGDGKIDMAVSNRIANTVSVFINTGTGTFAAKVDYGTGSGPINVTAADFNGDGKIDMGVANNGASTISVLMNTGTGTFAAKVDYATNDSYGITAADFNGDGKSDLVATGNSAGKVSVLMNTGTGTFAAKVDYTTGSNPRSVAAADFNGDGMMDFATANIGPGTASVFINTGTGTFATKVDYGTGSSPVSVVAADFNGDGIPDFVTANTGPSTASVLINTGTGTFAAKVDYAAGSQANAVSAADYNSDGQMDLALPGYSQVTVIRLAGTNSEVMIQPVSKFIVNAGGATIGHLIQGTAGQTGDLLQVRNDVNTVLLGVSATGNVATAGNISATGNISTAGTLAVTGAVTASSTLSVNSTLTVSNGANIAGAFTSTGTAVFRRASNTTTAFSIQQANTTSVFNVDTTNARVGIGNVAPGNKLSVGTLTTADSLAQTAIGTGAAGNKGLVVQAVAGQTADLLQAQSSTGAVLASIGASGTLTVTSAVVAGTLTVNGHVITGGTAPAIAAGLAACTSPTVAVVGNDTSGTITVTTGTGCAAAGVLATVTFNTAFGSVPRIVMTPSNLSAAGLEYYNDSGTTTTFTLDTGTVPASATSYSFNYWAVQ